MLIDVCLPKFDIYQSTVPPNCFKSHAKYLCPDFFQKKFFCLMSDLKFTLPDVTSYLTALKKYIFRFESTDFYRNTMWLIEFLTNLKLFINVNVCKQTSQQTTLDHFHQKGL